MLLPIKHYVFLIAVRRGPYYKSVLEQNHFSECIQHTLMANYSYFNASIGLDKAVLME